MKRRKLVALLLASAMCLTLLAGCKKNPVDTTPTPTPSAPVVESEGPTYEKVSFDNQKYTYLDSASTIPSNWNPHVYQTSDDAYPMSYITDDLFTMLYNDELNPVAGLAPYEGYVLVPAMAADYPVDVTAAVKAAHPEFNIPASATTGYAWSVKLRGDLKWDNGDPITAQDFVDSLERVLRGELLNYRAADYYDGSYVVINADKYSLQGTYSYNDTMIVNATDDEYLPNLEAFEKDENGQLLINGQLGWFSMDNGAAWSSNTLRQYAGAGYLDRTMSIFEKLDAMANEDGYIPATEETAKDMIEIIAELQGAPSVEAYQAGAGEYADREWEEFLLLGKAYEDNYPFSNVGLYVSGDNELTFVYRNAVDGFYLMTYAMSVPLVKIDLYDACLTETEGVWSSTYNTSVETTASYGPYKLSAFQRDKSMHFVKNDNWYGWNSGIYTYVDPTDGKQYDMYQTTDIDLQYVKEATTRKTMFLAGQLMGYGLQAEDFDQYRSSEFCYATPGQSVFGLILNGFMSVLQEREAAADFDQSTTDLEMMSVEAFKRALAVSIDRDDMCASVSPARSAGFGLIGTRYVYDPETGALYRDTDQAKQALCNFYSVDPANYGGDLDAAVAAITGFDPEAAAGFFKQAFAEGIEKGFITDNDGDGICDQTVTMQYALSAEASEFMEKTLAYLNESVGNAAKGTPFEGKIKFIFSAVLGNEWSNHIQNGTADCVLAGWNGATMDPFGFADTWTADRSYWTNWFDAKQVSVTMTINGQELTMSLRDWAECLNGNMKTVGGKEYNFGYGQVDVNTRLDILAKCEETVLGAYVTLPMLADGSMALLSQQVYYVVESYSPMMGRGGISYMKYNYSDTEWASYVSSQGGTLQY